LLIRKATVILIDRTPSFGSNYIGTYLIEESRTRLTLLFAILVTAAAVTEKKFFLSSCDSYVKQPSFLFDIDVFLVAASNREEFFL
jgi:hypothetical protein